MLGREKLQEARDFAASRSIGQPSRPITSPPPFAQGLGETKPEQIGAAERPTSILGPDITIIGQQLVLKTKGSLLIQGQIQGDVHGEMVTVDHGANVNGVVTARTIAVQGEVKGALKGSAVILHASAVVDADVVHQTLSIAEGAHFEGSVRRPATSMKSRRT